MNGLWNIVNKDEQARRHQQQKGVYNNQFHCPEQAARFARRQRDDEAWARSLGVELRYEGLRQ